MRSLRSLYATVTAGVILAFTSLVLPSPAALVGDFDGDTRVTLADLTVLAQWWLHSDCQVPGCPPDIDSKNGVNATDYAYFAANWGKREASLVISEFVASNKSTPPASEDELLDEDGESSDWIEIYNPASEPVSLDGWQLTNGNNDWSFPDGLVLAPAEFLIVFASGKDRASAQGQLHTDFQLDADGEYLALIQPDGSVAHEYAPEYPRQLSYFSYGMAQQAETFVSSGTQVAYRIPQTVHADENWTGVEFDDSGWSMTSDPLGFLSAPPETAVRIGEGRITGDHTVSDGTYTISANTGDIGNNSDSFYFIYRRLSGDGQFTAHVTGLLDARDWAKAGIMIRATLNPTSKHASQVVTEGHGVAFVSRPNTGGTTTVIPGARPVSQSWIRLVREGHKITGYYSFDGKQWQSHGSETVNMGRDVYVGLCIASHTQGTPCTATIESISDGKEIVSPIKDIMLGVNASLQTRITFEAEETDDFESMHLRMRYEDGFVAYLNGKEIARSGFTGQPGPASTADADRDDILSHDFVSFDVSPYTSHLRDGTNVLAIQGLNDSADDTDFLLMPELIAATAMEEASYFTTATPGGFNNSSTAHVLADTRFSHDRGFYDAPFSVTIHCETEGAVIHYTTDGTTPTDVHGNVYTGPIPIHTTTCLRAVAHKPGWIASDVDTQTYIFLDDVLQQPANPAGFPGGWDYAMDQDIVNAHRHSIEEDLKSLPTMSLVMNANELFGSNGIYTNWRSQGVQWERAGSIEMFYPDGTEAFQVNCGVRIYGGVGRRERKKSFRLLFKRAYGPTKLNYPLFGSDAVDEFDSIILRANFNDGYPFGREASQYIRDEFCRRVQLALGDPGAHGRYVHLYINGLYWGLYNPVERPDASFAASYLGGDKEDWDAYNSGNPTGDSTDESWDAFQAASYQNLQTLEGFQRIQGNNPDGTPNPEYTDYLNMENYVNYMFLNIFVGNTDWPGHNWYGAMHRVNSTGFHFFSWDAEWVLWLEVGHGLDSDLYENVTHKSNSLCTAYARLRQNPEFQRMFGDRAHRAFFNGGALYVDPDDPQWDPVHPERNKCAALYAELADTIERAMVCESARWGDVHGGSPRTIANWRYERDKLLDTYMRRRPSIVLDQLRDIRLYPDVAAPLFRLNGRHVYAAQIMPDDALSFTAPGGTIYYTLDGTDPLMGDGTTNPNALSYIPPGGGGGTTETVFAAEEATKRVLVPDGPINTAWRGGEPFDDSTWMVATGGVGYERSSGYQDFISLDLEEQMYRQTPGCYIRIPFTIEGDSGRFNQLTLKVRYDDAFVAYLNGSEIARAVFTGEPQWNSSAGGSHEARNLESFYVSDDIDLLKSGQNVLALHGLNSTATSSDMLLSAALVASETGQAPSEFLLERSAHVRARAFSGGNWSALCEADFSVGPVAESLRITEIMYHPSTPDESNDPNTEYIELQNISNQTINLNFATFTDGIDFVFPAVDLGPRQHVLVVEDPNAFASKYGGGLPVIGRYLGRLANGGERITLVDAAGQTIHDFKYKDGWYDVTDEEGFSLTIIESQNPDPNSWGEKDAWRASTYPGGSPGTDDSGILPLPGAIVINEVLAHSHDAESDWVELHNTTDSAVAIGGWFLSDRKTNLAKYEIPAGTTIAPNGYFVLHEQANFGHDSKDPHSHEGFALSENGETVYLTSALGGQFAGYRESQDFGASETSVSLGRYHKQSTGNVNFVPLDHPTPWQANAQPKVGPIVISEIMYNPDWPLGSPYGNEQYEYVEICNIAAVPVTLYRYEKAEPWKFTDGIDFTFPDAPSEITLAPGERIIIAKNPEAIKWRYARMRSSVVLGPFGGNLNDGGEKLEIGLPGDVDDTGLRRYIRVDRVKYSDGSHPADQPGNIDLWPSEPDGTGMSLGRIDLQSYGNDPANWQAIEASPAQ